MINEFSEEGKAQAGRIKIAEETDDDLWRKWVDSKTGIEGRIAPYGVMYSIGGKKYTPLEGEFNWIPPEQREDCVRFRIANQCDAEGEKNR